MFNNPVWNQEKSKNLSHRGSFAAGKSQTSFRYSKVFGSSNQKKPSSKFEDVVQNKFCTYYKVNGYYYSQGDKQSKLLGFKDISKLASKPLQICLNPRNSSLLVKIKFEKISCSNIHCLAMTDLGKIYS